ncbi:copper resistance CopC/CopD family protein [Oryzibacter oryziterrae]|uniref:copper resistance CopC/CopD family protein n=1 Tax=Oryzibacter oryziterrae TaxID=2766474 RepID=UPI001F3DAA24|nr:copper resistance protein CopC [Oryzibacter oryziterrae]
MVQARKYALVLLAFLCLMLPNVASAHAILLKSDPQDGAMLSVPPARVVLTFNEPVQPGKLALVQPDGTILPLEGLTTGNEVDVELPSLSAQGSRIVGWHVASADGHPVDGTFRFSVGAPSNLVMPETLETSSPAVRSLLYVTRLLFQFSLLFGVGGAVFWTWIQDGPQDRFTAMILRLGLLTPPLIYGLQGADLAGQDLSALLLAETWRLPFGTPMAQTLLAGLAALVLAFVSGHLWEWRGRLFSFVALVMVGFAFCLSGHAATAEPTFLTVPALFLHGVSLAFWLGCLLPLRHVLTRGGEEGREELLLFSRIIPFPVLLILGSGAILIRAQLPSLADLTSTDYGRLLLLKLTLVGVVLVAAALNRWFWTRDPEMVWRLRRSISVEIALIFGVLLLVGLWRFTPPPRVLAEAANQPISLHIHTLPAMADVDILPGRAGPVHIRAFLETGEFEALNPREVTVMLKAPDAGGESVSAPMLRGADGYFEVANMTIPSGGRWVLTFSIVMPDGSTQSLSQPVEIRG